MGWWSWALTAMGAFGLYLAGQKNVWGWAAGLAAQPAWMVYGYVSDQGGFIASGLIYGSVYLKNFIWWYREKLTQDLG